MKTRPEIGDATSTRALLLDAAEACYEVTGGERVRLADVTEKSGLTSGALYWHFANLDDLTRAMFDAYDAALVQVLDGAVSFVYACREWLTLLDSRPGTARVVTESVRPGRPLAAAKALARVGWLSRLEVLLPRGIPAGDRPVAARLVVDAVEGLSHGGAAGWAPRPDAEEASDMLGRITGALPPGPRGPARLRKSTDHGVTLAESMPSWEPDPAKSAPRTPRGRATADAIRAAAAVVFAARGIIDATVADIAREAGVSAGTVYQYFVDKHDIFRSLLFEARDDILPVIELAPVDSLPPVGPAMAAYLGYSRAHAGLFRAFLESIEPGSDYAAFWQVARRQFTSWAESAARAGLAAGRVTPGVQPGLLAQLTLSTAIRCAYERVVLGWDTDIPDADVARVFERLLTRGYERRTRSR